MDKDRVEGKLKDIKGKVERKIGEFTGDKDTETEGVKDQAEGKVQNTVGKTKDAVRDLRDKVAGGDRDVTDDRDRDERDEDVA